MFSIQNTFTLTQISFVVIFQLGNRLKYFDPQKLHTAEDEDPDWLQHLSRINAGFQVIFLFNPFILVINQSPPCNYGMCAIVGFSSSLMYMCICAYRMGLYSPCLEVSLHMVEAMEPVQLARRVEKLQATLQVENPPP